MKERRTQREVINQKNELFYGEGTVSVVEKGKKIISISQPLPEKLKKGLQEAIQKLFAQYQDILDFCDVAAVKFKTIKPTLQDIKVETIEEMNIYELVLKINFEITILNQGVSEKIRKMIEDLELKVEVVSSKEVIHIEQRVSPEVAILFKIAKRDFIRIVKEIESKMARISSVGLNLITDGVWNTTGYQNTKVNFETMSFETISVMDFNHGNHGYEIDTSVWV